MDNQRDSNLPKYEKRILDVEKQLKTNSERTERDMALLKSSMKTITDRYDKELQNLKNQFNDMTLRYGGRLMADKKSGKCIETEEVGIYQNKIRELKNQLCEKDNEYAQLSTLVKQIKDTATKAESSLKKEIQDLNNKLIVKDSLYESLISAKQSNEKNIEKKFEMKYVSQISSLTETVDANIST